MCDTFACERIVCERLCVKELCVEVFVFKLVVCVTALCVCGSLCVQVRERDVSDKVACERTVCSSLRERVV